MTNSWIIHVVFLVSYSVTTEAPRTTRADPQRTLRAHFIHLLSQRKTRALAEAFFRVVERRVLDCLGLESPAKSAPPSEDSGPVRSIPGDLLDDFFPQTVTNFKPDIVYRQIRNRS